MHIPQQGPAGVLACWIGNESHFYLIGTTTMVAACTENLVARGALYRQKLANRFLVQIDLNILRA